MLASQDEGTTEEPITSDSMDSNVRIPISDAHNLYQNIKIAIEGHPIPDDFVALSPLDCTSPRH